MLPGQLHAVGSCEMAATREHILLRYRHLRAINKCQQSDALELVSPTTMLDCARRLGLRTGAR
jgi:hypothetical protein